MGSGIRRVGLTPGFAQVTKLWLLSIPQLSCWQNGDANSSCVTDVTMIKRVHGHMRKGQVNNRHVIQSILSSHVYILLLMRRASLAY